MEGLGLKGLGLKGGETGLGTYDGDDVLLYLIWFDLTVGFEEITSDGVDVIGCFVVPNGISMKRRGGEQEVGGWGAELQWKGQGSYQGTPLLFFFPPG